MQIRHCLLSATLAIVLAAAAAPLVAQEETITWLGDLKTAIEESKRTGKPIFLEYRCEA
jgi:hypothetical protein